MFARLPSALLRIHPAIQAAAAAGQPVVALESTIITHGLPAPQNLRVALALEDAVRAEGAVPATTALLDGRAHVGLDAHELERLADTGMRATKTSRRDVAAVLAAGRGSVGATTVSGTMVLAHAARGIYTFGTGGIGGVHRGGETSLDVSADLTELARTPIAVFSSGAKSILDIPRTLEYLETMGVAVHTFEPQGHFPAFYTAQSGYAVPTVSSAEHAARIIHASMSLGLKSGLLFGVPIPADHEPAGRAIQEAVEQAVREHHEQGINRMGKAATPWLLKRVGELSQGSSVQSNTALVMNNVATAARAARELAAIQAREMEEDTTAKAGASMHRGVSINNDRGRAGIIIIGYAAVDVTSQAAVSVSTSKKQGSSVGTTRPGRNTLSLGGVGRNMAEAAQRIQTSSSVNRSSDGVVLVSPVGRDALAHVLRDGLRAANMSEIGLVEAETDLKARTASVSLHLDAAGDLITGVADVDETLLSADAVRRALADQSIDDERRPHSRIVGFDGNISISTMAAGLASCHAHDDIVLYEPTSVPRSVKIVDALVQARAETQARVGSSARPVAVHITTPNEVEAAAMHARAVELGLVSVQDPVADTLNSSNVEEEAGSPGSVAAAAADLARLFHGVVLVKGGVRGVLCARFDGAIDTAAAAAAAASADASSVVHLSRHHAHHLASHTIVNTTGAGDSFAGALMASVHACALAKTSMQGAAYDRLPSASDNLAALPWNAIIDVAQAAACLTLQSSRSVSPQLHTLGPRVRALSSQ